MEKVAVILSHWDVHDDIDPNELVIRLLALPHQGAGVDCFAPMCRSCMPSTI